MVFIAEQHCPLSTCWDPYSPLLLSLALLHFFRLLWTASVYLPPFLTLSFPPFMSHYPTALSGTLPGPLPPSSYRGSWRRETSCTRSDPPLPIMHFLSHTTQINSTLDQPLKAWMITLSSSVKQKQKGFCHLSPFAFPPNWFFSMVTVSACACVYYFMYFSIPLLHSMFCLFNV